MPSFDLSRHPIVFLRPRLAFPYAWAGHIPFAYLLMDVLRPTRFVELGTDSGNSYLAFCQAAVALGLNINCTAIDSWQGDEHARRYGEDVYQALKAYHDPRYASLSKLYRGYFDDAVETFADASIDLLHIDGLHTYEAVRHDFETWLPKLSARAVVVLHDTGVRERGFGVWKFFEELSGQYPSMEFRHSNGLGVVQTGPEAPAAFRGFLELFNRQPEAVRKYFEAIASTIVDARGEPCTGVDAVVPDVVARLYYRQRDEAFDEDRVTLCPLNHARGLMEVHFELPEGVRPAFVRLDPADFPGVYVIERISAEVKPANRDREPVHNLRRRVGAIGGDLLPGGEADPLRLVALSSDPYIEFDVADVFVDAETGDSVALMAQVRFDAVLDKPNQLAVVRAQASAIADLKSALTARESMHRNLEQAVAGMLLAQRTAHDQIMGELAARRERETDLQQQLDAAKADQVRLCDQVEKAHADAAVLEGELAQAKEREARALKESFCLSAKAVQLQQRLDAVAAQLARQADAQVAELAQARERETRALRESFWLSAKSLQSQDRLAAVGRTLAALKSSHAAMQVTLEDLQFSHSELQAELVQIKASTLWRVAVRLRGALFKIPHPMRMLLRRGAKAAWWLVTPWRMPARMRFLRERKRAVRRQD